MLEHCGVTLSKTIDIKDSAQVIKLIMTCKIHSFPDWALCSFSITNNTKYTVAEKIKIRTLHQNKSKINDPAASNDTCRMNPETNSNFIERPDLNLRMMMMMTSVRHVSETILLHHQGNYVQLYLLTMLLLSLKGLCHGSPVHSV